MSGGKTMVGGIKAMTLRMFGKVSNLQHIEVQRGKKSIIKNALHIITAGKDIN